MIKTDYRIFSRNGEKFRIRAEYGLRKLGNQAPYFSITGEINRQARNGRWVEDSCGCLHDEIAKFFPKLKPLIKWHLTSTDGPMHYLANSKYWLGFGEYSERNLEHFKSTCIYGALPEDTLFAPELASWPETEAWLRARFPVLIERFKEELAKFEVN